MMVPVGRLVVLRTVDRSDIVNALAWLTIPAMMGPIIGPPLGGFITEAFHWRWIFWINIPIAFIGIVLATIFVPDVRGERAWTRFQRARIPPGLGRGWATFLTGATVAGLGLACLKRSQVLVLMVTGIGAAWVLYVRHALRVEAADYRPAPAQAPSRRSARALRGLVPVPDRRRRNAIPDAPDAAGRGLATIRSARA